MTQFQRDRLSLAMQARISWDLPAYTSLSMLVRSSPLLSTQRAPSNRAQVSNGSMAISTTINNNPIKKFQVATRGMYVLLCPWLSWSANGLSWPADGAVPPRHQVDKHWRDATRHPEHASLALPVASRSRRSPHRHPATPVAGEWELELSVLEVQLWPIILIDYSNTQLGGGGSLVI